MMLHIANAFLFSVLTFYSLYRFFIQHDAAFEGLWMFFLESFLFYGVSTVAVINSASLMASEVQLLYFYVDLIK